MFEISANQNTLLAWQQLLNFTLASKTQNLQKITTELIMILFEYSLEDPALVLGF
jgi:hypothetical protein